MNENLTVKASKRKRQLYVGLLVFQVLLVFYPMFMHEFIVQGWSSASYGFLGVSRAIIILLVLVTNSLFVKEFISNIKGFYFVVFLNIIIFSASSISHLVPSISEDPQLFRSFHLISCCCVIITLFFTFFGAVKDIFKLQHDLAYSLLGATNIFLLIGSIFSFIINITGTAFVGMILPIDQLAGIDIYSNKLAFYTLATMEIPYDYVNPIIKNILVIQSLCSNLFVVIIVGRLLSKS